MAGVGQLGAWGGLVGVLLRAECGERKASQVQVAGGAGQFTIPENFKSLYHRSEGDLSLHRAQLTVLGAGTQ